MTTTSMTSPFPFDSCCLLRKTNNKVAVSVRNSNLMRVFCLNKRRQTRRQTCRQTDGQEDRNWKDLVNSNPVKRFLATGPVRQSLCQGTAMETAFPCDGNTADTQISLHEASVLGFVLRHPFIRSVFHSICLSVCQSVWVSLCPSSRRQGRGALGGFDGDWVGCLGIHLEEGIGGLSRIIFMSLLRFSITITRNLLFFILVHQSKPSRCNQ